MKSKKMKIRIRPFKGVQHIVAENLYSDSALLEFIGGMGYLIYEDPTDPDCVFISDRIITFGWLKKTAARWDINLKWWNEETDFNERLTEEISEYCY